MKSNNYFPLKIASVVGVLLAAGSNQVQAATVSFSDPTPEGISYEWTVQMDDSDTAQFIRYVGAKSWNEPTNPPGLKGWTHTSNWVALELTRLTKLTVTVEQEADVPISPPINGATIAGNSLTPAFSLYSGWQMTGPEDHQYNTIGNGTPFLTEINYLGHQANEVAASLTSKSFILPAGLYSIAIGSNPPDTTLTGFHGYQATLTTETVPEPGTLGMVGALATFGLGSLVKRKVTRK